MNPGIVFARTDKGREELASRKYHLQGRRRLALILVDGHSDLSALHGKAAGFDDLEAVLEGLMREGFIAPVADGPEPLPVGIPDTAIAPVKERLIAAAKQVLGDQAGRIVRILQEAPDTCEGLEQAVIRCKKLMELVIDEDKAAELKRRCLNILATL